MLLWGGRSRKGTLCFLSGRTPPISTLRTTISHWVRRLYAGSRIKAITRTALNSRHVELAGVVTLSTGLFMFYGVTGGQWPLVTHSLGDYVEDATPHTALAANFSQNAVFEAPSVPIGDETASGTISSPTIQNNSSMAALDPSSTDYIESFKPNQVVQYVVQSGDSIGQVAANFGVSINTIIWANDIKDPNVLSLGEALKIPPVSGIIHTVKNGDTVASIATKYGADKAKILSFNDLSDGQPLLAGTELMVPDGQLPIAPKYKLPASVAVAGSIYKSVGDGQCVPFVQAHGFADLHGNAYQWARYINTKAPSSGDAVVLKGGRFGHVAIITAVKASSIQVVEQNYYGPYIVDHRELAFDDRTIVGFITK